MMSSSVTPTSGTTGNIKLDAILTAVNVVITFVALVSAVKSWIYFKKSKHLLALTDLNKALVEIGKIQNRLPDALDATNKCRKLKGYGLFEAINNVGIDIQASITEMNHCIPANLTNEFQQLQSKDGFDLQSYINGYISGEAIVDNRLNSLDYASCQKCLLGMQNYLKKKIDEFEEKLK